MIDYVVNRSVDPGQLFAFYERNNICQVGFGPEAATVPLTHPSVIVTATDDGELIGVARGRPRSPRSRPRSLRWVLSGQRRH